MSIMSNFEINQANVDHFFDQLTHSRKAKKRFKQTLKLNIAKIPSSDRIHQYGDLKLIVHHPSFDFDIEYPEYFTICSVSHTYLQRYIGHWNNPAAMQKITAEITADDQTLFTKNLFYQEA